MRRLVAFVVIVSLLGLSTAAAWGDVVGDFAADAPAASDGHMHHGDGPISPENGQCDHGCHFSAHLTGLTSSSAPCFGAAQMTFAAHLDLPLKTSAQVPPRKPPRV